MNTPVETVETQDIPPHLCDLSPTIQAWYVRTYARLLGIPADQQKIIEEDAQSAVRAFHAHLEQLALLIPADGD